MRRSKALARLRNNEPVRMCSLGHFIPEYVRHAAHLGFDAIWLDLEHRPMGAREIQSLLAFFHLFDIDCMLRPPTLDRARLYRYLEDGASGLMIPHVSSEKKAQALVEAVKFPPVGNRGLDGAGLDADFILAGGDEFPEQANRETFLVVQIETPQAIEAVDRIAAVEGVDALFVGPGDLGLRLRQQKDSELDLQRATDRVAEAATRHGKAWGLPALSLEHLESLLRQGARLVSYGGDFRALVTMLGQFASDIDTAHERALGKRPQ